MTSPWSFDEEKKKKETETELQIKNSLIEEKKKAINNLTNLLENGYKKEKKKLEDEKINIEKELTIYKNDTIKQFLTIKIINDEVKNLTLNKDTINEVKELIDDLSKDKRFIDNREYFKDIIKEYEKIIKEIDESKGNANKIYERYNLDPELITKIDN